MDDDRLSDVDAAFRLFTRGLGQSAYQDIYRAHKELSRIGKPALEKVKNYIEDMDFSNPEKLIHANFVNGLFSLLLDLDEAEAVQTAQRVIDQGCSPVIALRLKTICEFSVSDYHRYEVGDISVYESKKLLKPCSRRRLLESWLSLVPTADLDDIHRLYIVPRHDAYAAGTYTPVLFNIMVAWNSRLNPNNVFAWPVLMSIQHTLYHEIGHHVHRHTFGQDPDQEREANIYAANLLGKQYPILAQVVRGVAKLIR